MRSIIVGMVICCFVGLGFLLMGSQLADDTDISDNKSKAKINRKVKSLLAKMTVKDKIGEMTQLTIDMLSVGEVYNLKEPHQLDKAKMKKALVDLRVGSILNAGGHSYSQDHWHEIIGDIQEMAMKEKKTGIPVLYGIDAIHGTNYTKDATLFPQQIGLAATWNTALAKTTGVITAYETRASGIPWNFSPVLDIGRDQRWPRIWETFGEDVLLASEMGTAMVQGYQGDNNAHPEKVAACMKHFVGYSTPITGKDRTQAWIPEAQLREYYLPTFKAAIDAGAKTIMINSGEVNGIPVHISRWLLTDVLRGELGFEGIAVTDWEDIKYLYTRHRVAHDYKEAIKMAIDAGIDMSMVPTDLDFPVLLKELVDEGKISEKRLDESVARILRVKHELDLFENPIYGKERYPDFASAKHAKAAQEAAEESITLLKNTNGILPLKSGQRILVTGPTANSLNCLNGGWTNTWQGADEKHNTKNKMTVVEALTRRLGKENITFVDGAEFDKNTSLDLAVSAAKSVEIAVVCLGEMTYTEKPGDLDDMNLPAAQYELVNSIAATGTPVVLVLLEGRPRIVRQAEENAAAVVLGYLPGNEGAMAIANVLSGEVNPSGKLPYTYPKFANSLLTYDHKGTDLLHRDFSMNAFDPQWEFGFGLSYTSFEYEDLALNTKELQAGQSMTISTKVTNTGSIAGKEVVQLYITDKVATTTPSVKRLRGFQKIELAPGASQVVSFQVKPEDLAFVNPNNQWITEDGEFEVLIGELKDSFIYQSGASPSSSK